MDATAPSTPQFAVFYGYQFTTRQFDPELLKETLADACKQAEAIVARQHGITVAIVAKRFEPVVGGLLLGELKEAIESSVLCVFEVSDRNPNVFLEAGYAMAERKRVVLMVNSEAQNEIPSDVKGITYLPYEKTNLRKSLDILANIVADEVWRHIAQRPLEQWFWEPIVSSPVDVFLGRTSEDNFSWGDVFALDTIRTHLQKQEMLRLNLESEIRGNILERNVISIGGPRRNGITKSLLDVISGRTRYCFLDANDPQHGELVQEKNLRDPYVIYNKESRQCFAAEVNFVDQPRTFTTGKDFGLVYRLTNPHMANVRWLLFAGISRAGTLACLEAMVNARTLSQVRERLEQQGGNVEADVEILFETLIVNGRGIGSSPNDVHAL
ncbi:MAG: nucleotide-binding protein [Planctomycetota bacterium]|nr:nucleotide-binding protein [Planctomycetota bacterium]